MLETVQQYGRERLRESGDLDAVRRRHQDWYLGLAERAEPRLIGGEQAAWLDRLEVEHPNLQAALRYCVESGRTEAALQLVGALWRFWAVRGYYQEGRGWLEAALKGSSDASPGFRAKALNAAGYLALSRGDHQTARSLLEESLTIRRQLGEQTGIAISLSNLGAAANQQGDHAAAGSYLEESLAIRRRLGDRVDIAVSLNDLAGTAVQQGDYARARSLLEESLAIRRQLGDKVGIAVSLNNLGMAAIRSGDHAGARPLLEESLVLCREVGDKWLSATVLGTLGDLTRAQGDHAEARSRYTESLAIYRQLEDTRGIADCLKGLAAVDYLQGQHRRAAQLFGAAAALREAGGAPLSDSDRAEEDRHIAAIRARLGEEAFAAAWAAGRAMTPERAIEYALEGVRELT
jgi:tetratricopeptide (TPR) repeat protein